MKNQKFENFDLNKNIVLKLSNNNRSLNFELFSLSLFFTIAFRTRRHRIRGINDYVFSFLSFDEKINVLNSNKISNLFGARCFDPSLFYHIIEI